MDLNSHLMISKGKIGDSSFFLISGIHAIRIVQNEEWLGDLRRSYLVLVSFFQGLDFFLVLVVLGVESVNYLDRRGWGSHCIHAWSEALIWLRVKSIFRNKRLCSAFRDKNNSNNISKVQIKCLQSNVFTVVAQIKHLTCWNIIFLTERLCSSSFCQALNRMSDITFSWTLSGLWIVFFWTECVSALHWLLLFLTRYFLKQPVRLCPC